MKIINKLIALIIAGGMAWCMAMLTALIFNKELRLSDNIWGSITVIFSLATFLLGYNKFSKINFLREYDINPKWYGLAEEEVNQGAYDKGLWAKALVKSKGNEEQRKQQYIKIRAQQLHAQNSSS